MKAETNFSQDWFSRSIPVWSAILSQLAKARQPLRILEVGVFEGRSTCWLLENYCRSAADVIVAVDDFSGDNFSGSVERTGADSGSLRQKFEANVRAVGSPARVDIRQGDSLDELARLLSERCPPFDFICVDGSHQAPDVLGDAVLAFRLLSAGGVIAFDDYLWDPQQPGASNPLLRPKPAIDSFTTIFSNKCRVLAGLPLYQVYIQKNS
jgi:predicted O-methyltransferase YrrM